MSTVRFVPTATWTTAIVEFIRDSSDGDEIVCFTEAQKKLATRAIARMCLGKQIKLTVMTDYIPAGS